MKHTISSFIFFYVFFVVNSQNYNIVVDTSNFKPIDMSLPMSILNSYKNSFDQAVYQFDQYLQIALNYKSKGDYSNAILYLNRCKQLNNRFKGNLCDYRDINRIIEQCNNELENFNSKTNPHPNNYNLSAFDRLRIAAEAGDVKAQFELGECYYFGTGVDVNFNNAVFWFQKAANQGNYDALTDLGYCYIMGKGIAIDKVKGIKCLTEAAEHGHSEAQYLLGFSFVLGEGVEKDFAEALYWLKKSADQGNQKAKDLLKEFEVKQ